MAADVPRGFEVYATESVPQAAPGSPGKDGRLELRFAPGSAGTQLVRDFAQAPFHVAGTLDSDPIDDAATVVVQSPTGGIAQGDRRDVTVEVAANATAHVGTSASTKVYSMDCNYASERVALSVESGGHLEYLPEPTLLHPDSRFCRSTTLSVAADATAIVGGVVVPGRLARGECFDFERYVSRTDVRDAEGALLATDATHLEPAEGSPQVPGVLGDHTVVGTLFVVAPGADAAALSDAVHDAVTGDGPERSVGTVDAGATTLPDGAGVLVRALGETSEPIRAVLRDAWGVARRDLLDAPLPSRRR